MSVGSPVVEDAMLSTNEIRAHFRAAQRDGFPTPAAQAGSLYLRQPIGTGEKKEASLIRETFVRHALW
jgi:hypothetical protein